MFLKMCGKAVVYSVKLNDLSGNEINNLKLSEKKLKCHENSEWSG